MSAPRGSQNAPLPPAVVAGARLLRSSSVPLYFQLAEILKERIEAGHWPAGGRFLSERELAEEFGISRTVIRPALSLLESDGQLVRIKGRGTFVTPPKMPCGIRGLARLLSAPPEPDLEVRLLTVAEAPAEPDIREVLEVDGEERVVQATALVIRSGSPVSMSNSFVPRSRLPSFPYRADEPPQFAAARVTIATAFLSQWEATQLEMAAGDLCFLIRYVEQVRAADGLRPIEFARIVFRSDVVELEADLT